MEVLFTSIAVSGVNLVVLVIDENDLWATLGLSASKSGTSALSITLLDVTRSIRLHPTSLAQYLRLVRLSALHRLLRRKGVADESSALTGRPGALPPQPVRGADVSSRVVVEILLVIRLSVPPLASLRDLRDDLAALDDERVLLLDFLENLERGRLLLWRVVEYGTPVLCAAVGALA